MTAFVNCPCPPEGVLDDSEALPDVHDVHGDSLWLSSDQ
jgi:hypothetical protein